MISLVLPTYNEAESIADTLKRLRALDIPDLEIIVCDDNSPDGTLKVAADAQCDAVCLAHPEPRGLSPSVVYGFEQAKGDILICMDADGQHRPEDLPAVIAAMQGGAKFAVGSRFVPGGGFTRPWAWYRLFFSKSSAWLARIFLGTEMTDPMSGFFVVTRDVFQDVKPLMSPSGFKIMLEMAAIGKAAGILDEIVEVPIIFAERTAGKSKISLKVALQYFAMLFRCGATCRRVRNSL